jgi:hypothetical protein
MNQRTANRSERLKFEDKIQNDRRSKQVEQRSSEPGYTPTPQVGITENRVRFVDNDVAQRENSKKTIPKKFFTKRDNIWEEKRKKKLGGVVDKVTVDHNLMNEYMSNVHNNNFTRQVYNAGTPRVDNQSNPQREEQYSRGGNNYTPQQSNYGNPNIQQVPSQSARSTPFTYNNRFQQQNTNIPVTTPYANKHVIQGGVNSNNYPRSGIPTPYQKSNTPHVLENQYYANPNAIVNNNSLYPQGAIPVYNNRITPGTNNPKPFQNITFRNQTPMVQGSMPVQMDGRIHSSQVGNNNRFNYNNY